MIYLLFPLILLNSHLGFYLFNTYNRTKSKNSKRFIFFDFWALTTVLIFLSKSHINIIFSACIPLLLGFLVFAKHVISNLNDENKKLNSIILICEMTLIYLKTGRSFNESLRISVGKVDSEIFKFCEIKKNVVMQQPKSSKSQLSTQYRAQSLTLILLWCGALLSLTLQSKVFLYKEAVFSSLLMMALGLILSKKILVKNEFRI